MAGFVTHARLSRPGFLATSQSSTARVRPRPTRPGDASHREQAAQLLPPKFSCAQEQLSSALELATAARFPVDRASASEWLSERPAKATDHDVLTVVWQSLLVHLSPSAELESTLATIMPVAGEQPIARVALEPQVRSGDKPALQVTRYR